ncbi:D-hexose-6-phosphate mutarotase [Glaciimonas soli]|nr:D-hexose-6-phosphate mutarotase [Glaciimonas soli]
MSNNLINASSQDGAHISVSLDGGHLCSWRTADGVEHLYLSPLTKMGAGAAIRGGIPIIFPQFASKGDLPKHGFARNSLWRLCASGDGFMQLTLSDSVETRALFPHAFTLTLNITFSARTLNAELAVTNTGTDAFTFTSALHTYLATPIADTALRGLQGCRYIDTTDKTCERNGIFEDTLLQVNNEVDSVFLQADKAVELLSPQKNIAISKTGFPDLVVWNPWQTLCAQIADLPDDAYQQFICVEAALVAVPMTLLAGESWVGSQRLEM